MKPLVIDFAPPQARHRPPAERVRWFAGGVGALLLIVSSAAWLVTSPVEASHMVDMSAAPARQLPGADQAQAVDAAVRELNLPWLAALDALAAGFGHDKDAVLERLEADASRGVIRITGTAHSVAAVQALPARLRGIAAVVGPFDGATLVSQEMRDSVADRPVLFVIELHLREGA